MLALVLTAVACDKTPDGEDTTVADTTTTGCYHNRQPPPPATANDHHYRSPPLDLYSIHSCFIDIIYINAQILEVQFDKF